MKKFGLIGYPLGHSFSKKYFSEKFAREKITDCSYENFPINSLDSFQDVLNNNPDLFGLNVTIPYKSNILKYVDTEEQSVTEIGAANVLKIRRKQGVVMISAFNSDITGISESLGPYINENVKEALIFGTGGSSKAVLWVLRKMGVKTTMVSRKGIRGSIKYNEITPEILGRSGLIVNTTPLGLYPDVSSLPEINYDLLDEKHILFDLVYNPEMTAFLKAGRKRGCKIITGINMLYSQAERSWEIWNDDNM